MSFSLVSSLGLFSQSSHGRIFVIHANQHFWFIDESSVLTFNAATIIGPFESCKCHQYLNICWNTNTNNGFVPVFASTPQLHVFGPPTLVGIGTLEFTLFHPWVRPCVHVNFSQRATIVFFWICAWSYCMIRGKKQHSRIFKNNSHSVPRGSKRVKNTPKCTK